MKDNNSIKIAILEKFIHLSPHSNTSALKSVPTHDKESNVKIGKFPEMLQAPEKSSVMGLPIHLSNDYSAWLRSRLQEKQGTHVVTLNSEMVMLAQRDPTLASAIAKADLIVPDGSGVVLYFRLRGRKQQRSPGIELAESLLHSVGQLDEPASVYFYGAKPGVVESAAEEWQKRVPGIDITTTHGYISSEQEEELKQKLIEQQPSVIFVALGVPRQELWIIDNRHLCPEAIWMGVGGSFDIWAGIKDRAPLWMQQNHLEWLYRLYQEPWRWRRMLLLPQFAIRGVWSAIIGQQ